MIRLKKKPAEEKKTQAPDTAGEKSLNGSTEEAAEPNQAPVTAEAKGTSGGENSSGGFKIINSIGGKSVRQEGAKITGKKRTPGELRVQKGVLHELGHLANYHNIASYRYC